MNKNKAAGKSQEGYGGLLARFPQIYIYCGAFTWGSAARGDVLKGGTGHPLTGGLGAAIYSITSVATIDIASGAAAPTVCVSYLNGFL